MIKEWIIGTEGENLKFKRETLLNYGMNRWGLNKAHSVGSTSELSELVHQQSMKNGKNFISQKRHKRRKVD